MGPPPPARFVASVVFVRLSVRQVALWDGIVMGGGVGLSIHSPIRVCTEKTLSGFSGTCPQALEAWGGVPPEFPKEFQEHAFIRR